MANSDPPTVARTDAQHTPSRRGTFALRGVHCLGCARAGLRALRCGGQAGQGLLGGHAAQARHRGFHRRHAGVALPR